MNSQNNIQRLDDSSISTLVSNLVNDKPFITIGRIMEVHNENFIKVRLYKTDRIINNVRLVHYGTDKCRVIISPKIGDNVMIFSSRIFIDELIADIDAEDELTLAEPYSNATMNAILISPESDENMLTDIKVDESGNVSLKSQGEIYAAVTDDSWEEQESVTIGLDNITIKDVKNDNTIVLNKDGMSAQNGQKGLFDVGNSIDTLGKLVDALIDEIINLQTFGSPYKHSVDPSSVVKLNMLKQKWAKVFKV